MADSENILFLRWEEVDADAAYVRSAVEELFPNVEFADLPLSDQQLALAVALMKKRAWRMHLIGRA
jgi:hypothetical protein